MPSASVLAEPAVSVVDRNVDLHGTRSLAESYLERLFTPWGQELAAANYYRPRWCIVQERVAERTLDLGFIESESLLPSLVTEVVAEDELLVVCAPGHPLAKHAAVAPAMLAQHAYISREPGSGTRDVTDTYLQPGSLSPNYAAMNAVLRAKVASGDHPEVRGNRVRLSQTLDGRWKLTGDLDPARVRRAVDLSLHKYCSVSKILAATCADKNGDGRVVTSHDADGNGLIDMEDPEEGSVRVVSARADQMVRETRLEAGQQVLAEPAAALEPELVLASEPGRCSAKALCPSRRARA